jgi:signal transduction histidine kinase
MFLPRNQLSANAVYSLLLHNGYIWAATGNGIEIFDQEGKRLQLKGMIKELQNEMIYALLPDDRGQVWFAGNHGIGCISSEKDRISYFNAGNNLQSLEFNSNAACRAPDGKLYFGGINGINGFDPSWFNPEKKEQRVRLLLLVVSDSAYTSGIPSAKTEIRLNRRVPHIAGKVFCSDYTNAGSQLFSFYLEGYQQGWSKPSQDAEFNYRDLPPGNYRLLAKCADSWQNWSDPELLISITLSPPFWKTGWFLFLVISLITLVTGLVVRKINTMRYSKQILALEQQNAVEKERLRISKDMHDDLGASLTRISILSEMAKKQQDDPVKSQQIIEQISGISGGVVDDMSEIIWAMNPRNDTLDSFTSYIRQYASSYLESAGIEGRFAFPGKVPVQPMSSEFRRNLFLTVKEALHNVVKHADAANVTMRLVIEGHLLRIVIVDDGKGFSVETIQGWGNGLINMRKRIEEHEGRFQISSGEGKGTTVEISVKLPLNKSHTKG